jgi:hypothetical protein
LSQLASEHVLEHAKEPVKEDLEDAIFRLPSSEEAQDEMEGEDKDDGVAKEDVQFDLERPRDVRLVIHPHHVDSAHHEQEGCHQRKDVDCVPPELPHEKHLQMQQ